MDVKTNQGTPERDIETPNTIVEVKSNNGPGLARQVAARMDPAVNPEGKVVIGYATRMSRFVVQQIEKAGGVAAGARTNASASEVEDAYQVLLKILE